jgi:hypothetical protein
MVLIDVNGKEDKWMVKPEDGIISGGVQLMEM